MSQWFCEMHGGYEGEDCPRCFPHLRSQEKFTKLSDGRLALSLDPRLITPKVIYEQRISWIRGMNFDRDVSREEAVKFLESQGIVDPDGIKGG